MTKRCVAETLVPLCRRIRPTACRPSAALRRRAEPIFLALEAEAHAKAGRSNTAFAIHCGGRPDFGRDRCTMGHRRSPAHQGWPPLGQRPPDRGSRGFARQWPANRSSSAGALLGAAHHQQGCGAEALQLVQTIYDQLTQAFDTADLRDVKALLAELKLPASVSSVPGRRGARGAHPRFTLWFASAAKAL